MNQPEDLSPAARTACEESDLLGIPAISCWEIALLAARGRLLDRVDIRAWLNDVFQFPRNQLLPLTPQVAVIATTLPPEIGRDPADRLIAATAIDLGVSLVTKDERIRASGLVSTIW